MGIVGEMSKLFLAVGTRLEVRGLDRLIEAIEGRPKGVPLLTVSNHTSTVDDPLIFGVLPTRILFNSEKMRWALGAAEITHRNALYQWFFSTGQVLPIRRGEGVFQPGMNDALCLLERGQWLHVFPEGKVIPDSTASRIRLKWGVGRLILDSKIPPIVLPIIHQGLENILPLNTRIPRFGRRLVINIGEPLDTVPLRERLSIDGLTPEQRRSEATSVIAAELLKCYPPNTD
jgi:monolysocardiolipin acyltransferase